MKKLLYLGPADQLSLVQKSLAPQFDCQIALDDSAVDKALPPVEVILDAYMRVRFPAERLARAPLLKLVITATTGADHIDSSTLERRGISLLTLQGQTDFLRNITPAAEHSWLLLMACARQLRPAVDEVLAGGWNRNNHPGIMLRGKTLGVVGCGRIGQWMATYATAFGMNVLGYDPAIPHWPAGILKTDLESLLKKPDFISVHVPLTEQTKGLLGSREFAWMRHGAVLINTSRGEVLNEKALLEALQTGRLRSAGLDVLTGEPDTAHHPLVEYARQHSNLIITPHIAGFSPDALPAVLEFTCQRILEYYKNHE